MSMDSIVLKQTSEQAPELPFYDQLIRYASRLMNGASEAEDIVQETYANYYRSGKRLKDVHLRNSLFVTARHLVIDHFRAKKADKSAAVDSDSSNSESVQTVESSEDKKLTSPLTTLANREFVELALDVLRTFPKRERNILHKKLYEGLTAAQIGAQLNLTEGNVRKILAVTIKKLRAAVNPQTSEPPETAANS